MIRLAPIRATREEVCTYSDPGRWMHMGPPPPSLQRRLDDRPFQKNKGKRAKLKPKLPHATSWMLCQRKDFDVVQFSNSEEEEILYSAQTEAHTVAATRSSHQHQKQYDEPPAGPSEPPPPKSAKAAPQADCWEAKEPQYAQLLAKDMMKGPSPPFHFDVLAQLANVHPSPYSHSPGGSLDSTTYIFSSNIPS